MHWLAKLSHCAAVLAAPWSGWNVLLWSPVTPEYDNQSLIWKIGEVKTLPLEDLLMEDSNNEKNPMTTGTKGPSGISAQKV